jgi:hypothetical protein
MGSALQMDPATVAAFANSLTPEQIAQTHWSIENTGRITMHKFKVSTRNRSLEMKLLRTNLSIRLPSVLPF